MAKSEGLALGIGIDHSQVLSPAQSGTGPSHGTKRWTAPIRLRTARSCDPVTVPDWVTSRWHVKYVIRAPELSGLPYTCYLSSCCHGYLHPLQGGSLILPKVRRRRGRSLPWYHATRTLPFPVCYVQTDSI